MILNTLKLFTAASKVLVSVLLNRFYSAKARPFKCPSSWINRSSSIHVFQDTALCKLRSQSSKRTSGLSPENLSMGDTLPFLHSLELGDTAGSLTECTLNDGGDLLWFMCSSTCAFNWAILVLGSCGVVKIFNLLTAYFPIALALLASTSCLTVSTCS